MYVLVVIRPESVFCVVERFLIDLWIDDGFVEAGGCWRWIRWWLRVVTVVSSGGSGGYEGGWNWLRLRELVTGGKKFCDGGMREARVARVCEVVRGERVSLLWFGEMCRSNDWWVGLWLVTGIYRLPCNCWTNHDLPCGTWTNGKKTCGLGLMTWTVMD
jgi:hypothetical protein